MCVNALAMALGVPATRIHEIVKERRGVTADTAMRLARFFGGDAESWLALQAGYDLKTLATREGPGRNDSLPDWVDDCLVVGEEPDTGNFLVVPRTGDAAGRVFTFAHDEFSFTESASCLRDFVAKQIELNDSVLTDIATVLRLPDVGGTDQWWIRSAVDNRRRRARSAPR